MSSENVEVVRRIYAAWTEGTSARGFMTADIEYVNPPDAVETGTLYGPESFGLIRDAYDDVEVRPDRFVDAGDEVVVVATVTGIGRGGRIPVERQQGYVWTVKDGKAISRATAGLRVDRQGRQGDQVPLVQRFAAGLRRRRDRAVARPTTPERA